MHLTELRRNCLQEKSSTTPTLTDTSEDYGATNDAPPSKRMCINSDINVLGTPPIPHNSSSFQTIPHQSPIEIFAKYLRALYKSRKLPVYGKWPPTPSKQFINLAVILKEKVSRALADDFTKATLRGMSDDIFQKKKRIHFSDLAKTEDGEPAQLILVEGAPGIGKSTFAWEACRKWGAGEIMQQYKLIVLLRLREKRVQQAKTIEDLFYYKNDSDPDIKASIVREIKSNDGDGTLLVLEGFDELPAQLRKENSLFMDIIKGERLTKATILITSRHWASRPLLLNDELHRPLSQHIEILGFTRKDIENYLECMTFDDPSLLPGLCKYLSCYPNIASMMYVPLNCAIVLQVYRESRSDVNQLIPKTMTELYTSLVRTLLIRYLHDHPKYGDTSINLCDFCNDLPEPVYEQFCELARIAYEGICNDEQIIFSDLPSNFETLGLMQCVPELYVDQGTVVSYNFLHLTLQEFLAAYHVSLIGIDVQINHFTAVNSMVADSGAINALLMMVEFMAGLTKLVYEKEKLVHFHRFIGKKDGNGWYSSFFHWLFEAQSASLLHKIGNTDIISFKRTTLLGFGRRGPFDYYVLGYCVSHSNCKWNIILGEIAREEAEMFVRGTADCDGIHCGKIVSLMVQLRDLEPVPLKILPACLLSDLCKICTTAKSGWSDFAALILHTPQLSELHLTNSKFPPGSTVKLFESLSSLHSFRILDIGSDNTYSEVVHGEDFQALGSLLSTSKGLTKLYLKGRPLVNTGITYISNGLKLGTLVYLNISWCEINSDGAHHVADALCCNDTLKELNVSYNPIGDDGTIALAQMLTRNKSLNVLELEKCSITEVGTIHLANALYVQNNLSLWSLNLGCNEIEDSGTSALAKMLTRNRSLKDLSLQWCSITRVGAIYLAGALNANSMLKCFNLMYNPITDQGAASIALMLTKNQSLKEFNVQGCGITELGAIKLAEALSVNSSLMYVNLRENAIKDEGASALAQMLTKNRSLNELVLQHCSITGAGANCLARALLTDGNITHVWLDNNNITTVHSYKSIEPRLHL